MTIGWERTALKQQHEWRLDSIQRTTILWQRLLNENKWRQSDITSNNTSDDTSQRYSSQQLKTMHQRGWCGKEPEFSNKCDRDGVDNYWAGVEATIRVMIRVNDTARVKRNECCLSSCRYVLWRCSEGVVPSTPLTAGQKRRTYQKRRSFYLVLSTRLTAKKYAGYRSMPVISYKMAGLAEFAQFCWSLQKDHGLELINNDSYKTEFNNIFN